MKKLLIILFVLAVLAGGAFFAWKRGYFDKCSSVLKPRSVKEERSVDKVNNSQEEEKVLKEEEKNLDPADKKTVDEVKVDFSDIDQELQNIESDLKKL